MSCGKNAVVDSLMADLRVAAAQLRKYEAYHRDKGTTDSLAKAKVNAQLAERFEKTIAESEAIMSRGCAV